MSSSISSHAHDLFLLEAAYQIGKYIQSFVTEDPKERSDKPWSDYSEYFPAGPNPYCNQTKTGLVLEEYYGKPARIHTPYGQWSILGNGRGDFSKVVQVIQGPLRLKLIRQGEQTPLGYFGPYWAITRWDGRQIEAPTYRTREKCIPYEKARAIWERFAIRHEEIVPKV